MKNHICQQIQYHIDRLCASGRVYRYRRGVARYHFKNHLLILGGSRRVLPILHAIALRPELARKRILILSTQPVESFREQLLSALSPEARRLSIICYRGIRTSESELRSCQVDVASHIFIVGEDDESEHDAHNVECWRLICALRANAAKMAQCHLLLLHSATTNLFHMLPQEAHTNLETTIVNHYESIALQLLSGNGSAPSSLTLDRGIITADSDRYVHLVIVGMTSMGYAMATAAAQLCHFPNFDPNTLHPLRTRITFIDPSADRRMNQFKCLYPTLFRLSHSRYMEDANSWMQSRPDPSVGDFLDVEWAFVKGSVDETWVRDLLVSCASDASQVLTVAFCSDSPEDNFAQSIHLPQQFYAVPDEEADAVHDSIQSSPHPLIYVFQPTSGALLETVRSELLRFRNIMPFGENCNEYDPLLTLSLSTAKRINYIYQKETSGKTFVTIPSDPALLDDLWRQLSYAEKMMFIHAAHALPSQLRSLGFWASTAIPPEGGNAWVEALSRMVHARWNIAQLLVGFSAMPANERAQLNEALNSVDESRRQEAGILHNRNANQRFVHKNIAPFDQLPPSDREAIRAISSHLPLVQ